RYADVEEAGHRAAGLTRLDQSDRSLAKIRRIGPWHSLLASNPASSLNHISPRAGIPSDSIGSGYALAAFSLLLQVIHRSRDAADAQRQIRAADAGLTPSARSRTGGTVPLRRLRCWCDGRWAGATVQADNMALRPTPAAGFARPLSSVRQNRAHRTTRCAGLPFSRS